MSLFQISWPEPDPDVFWRGSDWRGSDHGWSLPRARLSLFLPRDGFKPGEFVRCTLFEDSGYIQMAGSRPDAMFSHYLLKLKVMQELRLCRVPLKPNDLPTTYLVERRGFEAIYNDEPSLRMSAHLDWEKGTDSLESFRAFQAYLVLKGQKLMQSRSFDPSAFAPVGLVIVERWRLATPAEQLALSLE